MFFSIANETKLLEIENHLSSNQYLSAQDRPNHLDADIFLELKGTGTTVAALTIVIYFS